MLFRKVLIANRGEIAVRIIRALRELNIESVVVYTDVDRASLHVRMADYAARVDSYLSIESLLEAARAHKVEAIHPGYGFLSENADFAEACESAGLTFVGPSASSIRSVGSKTAGRALAMSAGVPVVPGGNDAIRPDEAELLAERIGYPVMLKAAAGGGGKGMRRVDSREALTSALRDASSEAERSFKNPDVYLEKLIEQPRHIEVQILGDRHGNLIHLGERECSLQRRHQKVVEECPAPYMREHPALRADMGAAAVALARAAGYYNAGTVEFLIDQADGKFYFLEVNTRLQVEHPVTELVTGLDLVHWQLRIAAGERLTISQEDVAWNGSAIECRLGAEDPENQFFPSPGRITDLVMASGPGVRLDSGIYAGWTVPMEYDPLLAKLVVWAPTRDAAIARMLRALEETHIGGIKSNVGFFLDVLRDSEFRAGRLHTGFIPEFFNRRVKRSPSACDDLAVALAALAVPAAKTTHPKLSADGWKARRLQ